MASPNLVIAHVAAAQNQKEVTVNDAIDKLDMAGNDTVDIGCTAGNTTVSPADYRENFLIRLTGTPAADFTLTLPDGKRVAAFHNTTAKAATVRTATLGATVTLRGGELSIVPRMAPASSRWRLPPAAASTTSACSSPASQSLVQSRFRALFRSFLPRPGRSSVSVPPSAAPMWKSIKDYWA
jgi:hypothetical protein